jgi:hypothetical protein
MKFSIFSVLLMFTFAGCQSSDKKTVSSFKNTGSNPIEWENSDVPFPEAGRYLGFVKVSSGAAKLPLVLDFILVQSSKKTTTYEAVSRINLGNHNSHEYVSSYFPNVKFDGTKNKLTFKTGNRYQIESVKVIEGSIKGVIVDTQFDFKGDFVVNRQININYSKLLLKDIYPKLKVQTVLAGSYKGTCENESVNMQIESFRGWQSRNSDSGSLNGYRTVGRVGKTDSLLCAGSHSCTKENYLSATYNIYSGDLQLKAPRITKTCKASTTALSCEKCSLNKFDDPNISGIYATKPYATFARKFKLDQTKSKKNRRYLGITVPSLVSGQYYGYVHHESNDTYQLIALNVKAKDSGSPKSPVRLQTVATLYFGEGDSAEFIAYKFDTKEFPKNNHYLVFNGPGESYFAVSKWKKETVEGVWISKTRGRIGTVELQRDLVPILPKKYSNIKPISGSFEGKNWIYEISAAADISESETDVFPLRIYGWAKEKIPGSRRRMIEGGSFDYFTGSLAFGMDDGRTVVGKVSDSGMDLFWPPKPRYGLAMIKQEPSLFIRVSAEELKHALLQK